MMNQISRAVFPKTQAPIRTYIARATAPQFQQRTQAPASTKLARVFMMELNKVKSEARLADGDPKVRSELESRLVATPLSTISGLDAKVVAQLLSTLETIAASGTSNLVDDSVEWILNNRAKVKPVVMVPICKALNAIVCPRRVEVLEALAEGASMSIGEIPLSTAVALLSCYVAEAPHSPLIAQLIPKVRAGLEDITASDIAELWSSVTPVNSRHNVELKELLTTIADTCVKPQMLEMAQPTDIPKLFRGAMMFADKNQTVKSELMAIMEKDPLEFTLEQVAAAVSATAFETNVEAPIRASALKLLETRMASEGPTPLLSDVAAVLAAHAALNQLPSEALMAALRASGSGQASSARDWSPQVTAKIIGGLESLAKIDPQWEAVLGEMIDVAFPKSSAQEQSGFWLAARMRATVLDLRSEEIRNIALRSCDGWSPSEIVAFLKAASHIPKAESRRIMRDMAPKIVERVQTADGLFLTSVAAAYGRARVRHENLCTAISERAIATKEMLGMYEVSTILSALAAVEQRNAKCFLDLIPSVRANLHRCTATQVTSLIAAFAKMSVWNYRLFSRLGDRALAVAEQLTTQQVVAIVASLHKMDVRHVALMAKLAQLSNNVAEHCSLGEAVGLLSAFSKTNAWDVNMFETLGKKVVAQQSQLDAPQLGEVLMAFARVDLKAHSIFQDLSLTALALAPTCAPLPLAAIITAYASVHCQHIELFNVLAERALALKDECPAATLSAVLVAFATVGIKNDKLFIEMIPRMRHVTYYGGPQDVANVLVAYTNVGLWHYKLFVRLADRAIAVKGDCQGSQLAKILGAFAKVEMRYEKLFTEMSIKTQNVAKTLNPGDVATIANAYASANIFDANVFKELGQRAISVSSTFEEQEVVTFLTACKKAGYLTPELEMAFPNWKSEEVAKETQTTESV